MESGSLSTDTLFPPLDNAPVLLFSPAVDYPKHLIRERIEGEVVLDIAIDETGAVDTAIIIESVHPVLDSIAAATLLRYRYAPATADAESVAVLLRVSVPFSIDSVAARTEPEKIFTGTVIEKGTRRRVPYAQIGITFLDPDRDTSIIVPFSVFFTALGTITGQEIQGGSITTLTDSAGSFSFYSIPRCSILVSITHPSYEVVTFYENIPDTGRVNVRYRIPRREESEYEIVVYGQHPGRPVTGHSLPHETAGRIAGMGGDPLKSIRALPGVAIPRYDEDDRISFRGARPRDSRFFLDGVGIPKLFHGTASLAYLTRSIFTVSSIDTIAYIPSGFDVRYGNSIGGVVELSGKSSPPERFSATADLNMLDISGAVTVPVIGDGVSFAATARRSVLNEFIERYNRSDVRSHALYAAIPFYWDYTMRTDIQLASSGHLFLTAVGAKDGVRLVIPEIHGVRLDEAQFHVDNTSDQFNVLIAGWEGRNSNDVETSLRFSVANSTHNYGNRQLEYYPQWQLEEHLEDRHLQTRYEKRFRRLPALQPYLGIDLSIVHARKQTKITSRKTTQEWKNEFEYNSLDTRGPLSGYIGTDILPSDALYLTAGLRYDYYPELLSDGTLIPEFWDYRAYQNIRAPSGDLSFRCSSRYRITGAHTLKAAIGNYTQSPMAQTYKTVLDRALDNIETEEEHTALIRLPSSKAAHYVLGHEWSITDILLSDIQCYFINKWDIARTNGSGVLAADRSGRAFGIELMLRLVENGKLSGWLGYSLSRSEYTHTKNNKYTLSRDDHTHYVQAVGTYRPGPDWEIGARLRGASGHTYTPATGVVYDADRVAYDTSAGIPNSARHDPIALLDLRIGKRFVFSRWILESYLDLQNVLVLLYKSELGIKDEPYYRYNVKTGKHEFEAFDSYFVPFFGLSAEF
jgi:TonB family protein